MGRISNIATECQLVMKMTDKRSRTSKDEVKGLRLVRITESGGEEVRDIVVRECPLTVVLNGIELVTLLCTPTKLKELAVGFLYSEGLLKRREDLKRVTVDRKRGVAWVESKGDKKVTGEQLSRRYITTGCGRGTSFSLGDLRGAPKVKSKMKVASSAILNLMKDFQERSEIHRMTGGVHNAALCDKKNILLFSEDVGRHSAIDKILGESLLKGLPMKNRLLMTSGRTSSDILLKAARAGIPIVVSKSAPTDVGVKLAEAFGITLIGFVRGSRMNVYSNGWRVVTPPRPS